MTEQEIKEKREAIQETIEGWEWWDGYKCLLSKLSSLGVVIADKDYESWLKDSGKTHSLLEEK
jgi:hypothetical protein